MGAQNVNALSKRMKRTQSSPQPVPHNTPIDPADRTNRAKDFGNGNSLLRRGDPVWQGLITTAAVLLLVLILAIGALLWIQSDQARAEAGWKFLLPNNASSWDPANGVFEAWPMIYGTLVTSLIAILVALPLSLGVAVFLAELCPSWLKGPIGRLVELLAAIPSVVFGLWGIFVFLPIVVAPIGEWLGSVFGKVPGLQTFFGGEIASSGTSRLAAGMIMGVMIIPTIALVTRDIFEAIPNTQREASFALGATRWETISRVLIPASLPGILGALILGLGRALGETMAVTMVIGNSIESSLSLLRPGYTLSSIIANEFAEAVTNLHYEALIEVALVLFVMTLVLNLIARFLVWRVSGHGLQGAKA
jgi:phosphate transport system permease protein